MTSHAQIRAATADVAERLKLTEKQLNEYCRQARRAGYLTRLDRLAAVLIAGSAPDGARGPDAADRIAAGIYRDSPARQEDSALRLNAEIRRRCPSRGEWQQQVQAAASELPPRDRHEFARWCRDRGAWRMFPGRDRESGSRRRRWRDGFDGGQGELM